MFSKYEFFKILNNVSVCIYSNENLWNNTDLFCTKITSSKKYVIHVHWNSILIFNLLFIIPRTIFIQFYTINKYNRMNFVGTILNK